MGLTPHPVETVRLPNGHERASARPRTDPNTGADLQRHCTGSGCNGANSKVGLCTLTAKCTDGSTTCQQNNGKTFGSNSATSASYGGGNDYRWFLEKKDGVTLLKAHCKGSTGCSKDGQYLQSNTAEGGALKWGATADSTKGWTPES